MGGRQRGGAPPPQPHPGLQPSDAAAMAAHRREIQGLLSDQQQMAATHGALKQDLSLADQELRQLAATARKVSEERESHVKDLYEKSLNMEAQLRAIEALNAEHSQVIAHVQKLTESKIELTAHFKAIDVDLSRVKKDAAVVPAIKADIESMKQELQKGRDAIEFEKKTREANLEQKRAMERNMNSLQREIERLRAELANAEKRVRAAAAATSNPNPGYMGNYGSPNMMYGGGPYAAQYSLQQVQITADGASPALYGHPTGSHGPVDMQQPHVPKG